MLIYEAILGLLAFIVLGVLIMYIFNLRDKIKYLNRLCDRQAQELINERRSHSIERREYEAKLHDVKRSYKRAESRFKI